MLDATEDCPAAEKDSGSALKIARTYVTLERQLAAADVCALTLSNVLLTALYTRFTISIEIGKHLPFNALLQQLSTVDSST